MNNLTSFLKYSLLCSLLLSISCVVTIKSIKDPNYKSKFARIFIYLKGAQDEDSFFKDLGLSIAKGFSAHGVSSKRYVDGTLTLSSKTEIYDKIKTYSPDVIMEVVQTQISSTNGATSGAKLEISLIQIGNDKPIWKASVSSYTSGYYGMGNPSQIANNIISKLVEDEMIN